jgi:hypothetical protein
MRVNALTTEARVNPDGRVRNSTPPSVIALAAVV